MKTTDYRPAAPATVTITRRELNRVAAGRECLSARLWALATLAMLAGTVLFVAAEEVLACLP